MTPDVNKTGRYENQEKFKFWSGEIRGNFVTIRFGNIGTSGHCSSKEFPSQAAAENFLKKRKEEKIAEGFSLVEEEE
ncbi:MAG: WGR domain-containing protein [Candidatus Lokiarchaeota archaeon]|nr:WGR domain-containing protein [Candidatus Lokiarchaeota archaeon]